jgi:hypothetical protein
VVKFEKESAVDATRYETFWPHVSALPVRKPSSASFSIRDGLTEHPRQGLRTIDALWASARTPQLSWKEGPAVAAPAVAAPAAPPAPINFVEMSVYMGPWSESSVEVRFERS